MAEHELIVFRRQSFVSDEKNLEGLLSFSENSKY